MVYTSKNILGVRFTKPESPKIIYEVVDIVEYDIDTPDLLLTRSDQIDEVRNTMKFVLENLNSGRFKEVSKIVENFQIY